MTHQQKLCQMLLNEMTDKWSDVLTTGEPILSLSLSLSHTHTHTHTYVTCQHGSCEQPPINHLPDHQLSSHHDNLMLDSNQFHQGPKVFTKYSKVTFIFRVFLLFMKTEITRLKNAILDHKLFQILLNYFLKYSAIGTFPE